MFVFFFCYCAKSVYTVFLRQDVHVDIGVEVGCEVESGIVVWEGVVF